MHFPIDLSPIKLTLPPIVVAYSYVGGILKTNVKEIYHPLVYIIQSATLNQHLSFSKEKKI